MAESFFHPSLFPTKGDFDRDDFTKSIEGTGLIESIRNGIINAMADTKSVFMERTPSLILFGQFLHERVVFYISQECNQNMGVNSPIFSYNQEGNQKNYFSFADYIFIVAKGDVKKLDTRPNRVIAEQLGEKHVITVSYLLDASRDYIVSISLEYKKGNRTIFSYPISLSSVDDNTITTIEPQVQKPKFKASIVNKEKNATV